MRHFTTTKDRFPEVRNKVLIGIISVYGIVAFVILYMFTSSKTEPDYTWVYTLTIIAPVLAFSTYRTIKRQKKMFETYLLTITDDTVIREQDNTPTITIAKDRIKKIIRTSAGIYCVIGESQLNAIAIPAQIEDRDDLEQLLSGIMPITAKTSGNALQWFYLAIGMLAVAAAFMGLASEDRIVFTLSALVICGVMLWGFVVIHRSKKCRQAIETDELHHDHSNHGDGSQCDPAMDERMSGVAFHEYVDENAVAVNLMIT